MKICISIFIFMLASQMAFGLDRPDLVFAGCDARQVSAALRQQADFVSIPVLISSWTSNKNIPVDIKKKIMSDVLKKAGENPDIIIIPAGSPPPENQACATAKKPKYPRVNSKADFLLLVRFRGSTRNIEACAAMMRKFLLSIPLPDKVNWHTGKRRLIVENPEQYRPKILELISKTLSNTRQAVKNGKVSVAGLERPVLVRPADGGNVELFIDYQVSADILP